MSAINYALVDKYMEFFRQKGFREEEIPVAFTNEDYVRIGTMMIRNPELRGKVGMAYKEFLSCNRDGKEFLRILEAVTSDEEIFTVT